MGDWRAYLMTMKLQVSKLQANMEWRFNQMEEWFQYLAAQSDGSLCGSPVHGRTSYVTSPKNRRLSNAGSYIGSLDAEPALYQSANEGSPVNGRTSSVTNKSNTRFSNAGSYSI